MFPDYCLGVYGSCINAKPDTCANQVYHCIRGADLATNYAPCYHFASEFLLVETPGHVKLQTPVIEAEVIHPCIRATSHMHDTGACFVCWYIGGKSVVRQTRQSDSPKLKTIADKVPKL